MPPFVDDLFSEARAAVSAVVADELRGTTWQEARSPRRLRSLVDGLLPVLRRVEELFVWLGSEYPMPGRSGWPQALSSGVTTGAATAVGQAGLVSAANFGAAVAGVVVAECAELYFAASARAQKYRGARRRPGYRTIRQDLSRGLGGDQTRPDQGWRRFAGQEAVETLLTVVADRLQSSLVLRATPLVGSLWTGGTSAASVRRLYAMDLAPVFEDELLRLSTGEPEPEAPQWEPGTVTAWLLGRAPAPALAPLDPDRASVPPPFDD